jgi:hypothetical protein
MAAKIKKGFWFLVARFLVLGYLLCVTDDRTPIGLGLRRTLVLPVHHWAFLKPI